MRREVIIALAVALPLIVCGPAVASPGSDGTLTLDKDARVWPAKRLDGDGTKKMSPVTFNHGKHGDQLGCATCHHTEATLKPGDTGAASCFECHGPEAKDGRPDSHEVIHGKKGSCVACHKTDTRAQLARAPQRCPDCHKGSG